MSTIVSISTSVGTGGIGIVRLSGEDAFEILSKIFVLKNSSNRSIKGYTIKYGNIVDKKSMKMIDEVLVSYFVEPKSYTRENMCEINCHGGKIVLEEILSLCLKEGAVMAEPGEFTQRAFLNGRIDLSQAEATIDIINSKSKKEKEVAINQLQGDLSNQIKLIRDMALDIMVNIETNIDYPEYDIEEVNYKNTLDKLIIIKEKLVALENSFDNGKIIKEGIKTVIVGKPNVGKSSLLNAILNEERAIVTDIEGTTRDLIEESVIINGLLLKFVDTAGIRETNNVIEEIGIKKSKESIKNSDLVIYMLDSTKKLDKEDLEILETLRDKKTIILINKKDLNNKYEDKEKLVEYSKYILDISTLDGSSIEELKKLISNFFNVEEINSDNNVIITNSRHRNEIVNATEFTNSAIIETKKNMPEDIISIFVKDILEALGNITGDNVSENILDEIFSKFCLGK